VLDHLSLRSPCYREFSELRKQVSRKGKQRMAMRLPYRRQMCPLKPGLGLSGAVRIAGPSLHLPLLRLDSFFLLWYDFRLGLGAVILLLLFIEQHSRVWILHHVGRAVRIISGQIGVSLCHFFCDEPLLQGSLSLVVLEFVEEGNGPKHHQHIGDFTHWKDHDSYQKAFERLLRDLKADEASTPTVAPK